MFPVLFIELKLDSVVVNFIFIGINKHGVMGNSDSKPTIWIQKDAFDPLKPVEYLTKHLNLMRGWFRYLSK